jgi:hypothetical protein
MRSCGVLALALALVCLGLGCTAEDKRQWHEAWKDLRGDYMEFGAHDHRAPDRP